MPDWHGDYLFPDDSEQEVIYDGLAEFLQRYEDEIARETSHVAGLSSGVGDPSPWTAQGVLLSMQARDDGVLFEYACTEGNYGMANILSGARAGEREAGSD